MGAWAVAIGLGVLSCATKARGVLAWPVHVLCLCGLVSGLAGGSREASGRGLRLALGNYCGPSESSILNVHSMPAERCGALARGRGAVVFKVAAGGLRAAGARGGARRDAAAARKTGRRADARRPDVTKGLSLRNVTCGERMIQRGTVPFSSFAGKDRTAGISRGKRVVNHSHDPIHDLKHRVRSGQLMLKNRKGLA